MLLLNDLWCLICLILGYRELGIGDSGVGNWGWRELGTEAHIQLLYPPPLWWGEGGSKLGAILSPRAFITDFYHGLLPRTFITDFHHPLLSRAFITDLYHGLLPRTFIADFHHGLLSRAFIIGFLYLNIQFLIFFVHDYFMDFILKTKSEIFEN